MKGAIRPGTGRRPFDWRIGVWIAVDFEPEIAKLMIERFLAHLDPPGLRAAVASVRPAIASHLQVILHVEGAVFREYPDTRPLACLVEFRERGGSRSISLSGENLQERETVIDSPMTILEVARLHDEVCDALHEAGHHDRNDKLAAVERRKSRRVIRKYLRVSQKEVEDWFRLSLGRHARCRHGLSCRFGEISK